MKPRVLVILLILPLADVFAGEFRRDIPRTTWEPIFFRSIDKLSRKVGWQPLRAAPVVTDSLEVRVWIGFGVMPLEAFRLRRDGTNWSAQHVVDTVEPAVPVKAEVVSPKSDWQTLWHQLDEFGLLTLPDSSALPPPEEMAFDGESYVVEINTGNAYRTYQYGNPQFQRWPQAKKIVRIIEILHHELATPPKA